MTNAQEIQAKIAELQNDKINTCGHTRRATIQNAIDYWKGKLAELDKETMTPVQDIKKGEFVRRKPDAKKTYIRGDYCKFSKAYELTDYDDMNRQIYVKRGVKLATEFNF